jgi:hypothetical protein
MHGLVRLSLFCATLAMPATAFAQEQENPSTPGQIPDPSTYQGSTVLQQQSDQQDQQFREQQQQQQQSGQSGYSSGQSGASYGNGYSRNSGSGTRPPSYYCNQGMERSPALAPLRGLVELGGDSRDPRYFTISRRASPAEKPVLMKWLAARHHCETVASGLRADVQAMNLRSAGITDKMIVAVAEGRMTFGDFNYTRAHNALVVENYQRSH